MSTVTTQPPIPTPSGETIEQRFRRLAAEWERDTWFLSSPEKASKHPAYQEIISMGEAVVPLLLRDLEQNHTHWFIALRKITGASPIPKADAGNVPRMVQAWVQWAKANGYSW